jgi:hypothetical protein
VVGSIGQPDRCKALGDKGWDYETGEKLWKPKQ